MYIYAYYIFLYYSFFSPFLYIKYSIVLTHRKAKDSCIPIDMRYSECKKIKAVIKDISLVQDYSNLCVCSLISAECLLIAKCCCRPKATVVDQA